MDTNTLLEYLVMVSNNNILVNLGMHLLVLISIVSIYLLKNMKLRKYIVEGTVLVLCLSVTTNAIIFGNPFHALTFGIMTLIGGLVMVKGKNNIGKPQSGIRAIIAFCIILLGLWYPELVKANILGSLLLSPLGVVPCPTLITTLGLLNLFYPDVNNKQFMVTVFFGIVYGLIGTFKLGVHFDLCLLGAAIYSIFNMIIVKHVIGFTGNVGNPAL